MKAYQNKQALILFQDPQKGREMLSKLRKANEAKVELNGKIYKSKVL